MKLLENTSLELLSSQISNSAIDCMLDVRIEAYSCKMVQSDKKQWKTYDAAADRQPLSPPEDFLLSASPIVHSARLRHLSEASGAGSDDNEDPVYLDSISSKTLFELLGVLNISYPDYDFSAVGSSSFSLLPSFEAASSLVDTRFAATVHDYTKVCDELWSEIDKEIDPRNCKIYAYKTEYADDPFSEDGCIWCLNLFFYNKVLKRLVFLSCRALSSQNSLNVSGENLWEVED